MPIEPGGLNLFRPIPQAPAPTPPTPAAPEGAADGGNPFLSRLTDAVRGVNDLQNQAGAAAENLATGRADNVQDVVIAMEKADLALQLTVQVTQKAVDAYREISRMQV